MSSRRKMTRISAGRPNTSIDTLRVFVEGIAPIAEAARRVPAAFNGDRWFRVHTRTESNIPWANLTHVRLVEEANRLLAREIRIRTERQTKRTTLTTLMSVASRIRWLAESASYIDAQRNGEEKIDLGTLFATVSISDLRRLVRTYDAILAEVAERRGVKPPPPLLAA